MNHQINWNDITIDDRGEFFITKSGANVIIERSMMIWKTPSICMVSVQY